MNRQTVEHYEECVQCCACSDRGVREMKKASYADPLATARDKKSMGCNPTMAYKTNKHYSHTVGHPRCLFL